MCTWKCARRLSLQIPPLPEESFEVILNLRELFLFFEVICKIPLKRHCQISSKIGVAQTVFLVNRVFVPCQKRGRFDENGENDKFTFHPLKTRASHIRLQKTTKMAGVTQAKAWFRKSRVCSSLKEWACLRFFVEVFVVFYLLRVMPEKWPQKIPRVECSRKCTQKFVSS